MLNTKLQARKYLRREWLYLYILNIQSSFLLFYCLILFYYYYCTIVLCVKTRKQQQRIEF